MAIPEVGYFFVEAGFFLQGVLEAAGLGFVVVEAGIRGEDDLLSKRAGAETEVDVV